jgi:enoyl-CoA hydratase/carnithine racemase
MMTDLIRYEEKDKVLLVTLAAEKSLNALNMEMLEDLVDHFRAFERNPALAAAVLTGSGKSFSTGADLGQFTELTLEEIWTFNAEYGHDLFNYLAGLRKPVIAAVNGYAMGGGFELALACDFRVASEKAVFSAPEYGFGWIPAWGGVNRLASITGPAKAKEILLFKKRLSAAEALALGIVSEVVPAEQLPGRALEMAGELAALNPMTVQFTKAVLDNFTLPQSNTYLQALCTGVTSKMPYAREELAKFNRRAEERKRQKAEN